MPIFIKKIQKPGLQADGYLIIDYDFNLMIPDRKQQIIDW